MARIGSVAAAPFAGDEFASLYLGAERVPSVPGRPTIISATEGDNAVSADFLPPANNGGASFTVYRFYVNGGFEGEADMGSPDSGSGAYNADETIAPCVAGDSLQVSGVNEVGEGPKSEPFTVVAA